ncbi:MAG: TonB-dependent receptor [Paludibacteraceae bacterium]|nr:TonB-dependent receptor [Paludibacteraceae bacterium]
MQSLTIKFILVFFVSALTITHASAQKTFKLRGIVTDEFNHPLAGATVQLMKTLKGISTDRRGAFSCNELEKNIYVLKISFLGYQAIMDTISVSSDMEIRVKLYPKNKHLDELTVKGNRQLPYRADNTLSIDIIDKSFLQKNTAGSLMQNLSRLPGVSSMNIGSGQSKPSIRGLGFNRVAVAENGIKHEAQEWGVDHGLEIDQFSVERLEVIKGPASLMYGANAIGGVIDLKQIATPLRNSSGADVLLHAQSNNQLLGASAKYFKRFDHFYFKVNGSYSDYSDYKIPADSINYMTYNIKLKNRSLRNTAGRERSGSVVLGYLNEIFSTHLSLSDNFSKSGFFANAHGLEIRNSQIDYDTSSRDIDLPSQQVNHFKVLSNSIWMMKDYKLKIDLGYQNNYRQEFSERVAHGNMPLPPDSLERLYHKSTYTANLKLEIPKHNIHQLSVGINGDYQENRSGGWGFMLPDFKAANVGAFLYDNIQLNEKWQLNAGLRYDYGMIHTDAYYDWYGTLQPDGEINVQRAWNLNKHFANFNWGAGASYLTENTILKINVGKSFRMPSAKEIASNGINYHMYRYEKGDSTLKAEESYQLDLGLELKKDGWEIEFSPFVNYFANYIYLNPTAWYYEAQQIYFYSQSAVFRAGGELMAAYQFSKALSASIDVEYIYSLQLSGSKKGYTLPFSPPLNAHVELVYKPEQKWAKAKQEFGTLLQFTAAQNNIVPPEKKTPGYILWSLNAASDFMAFGQQLRLNVHVNNVLNKRYYDHTSFYRLIEVPGQGRNMIVTLQIPFK